MAAGGRPEAVEIIDLESDRLAHLVDNLLDLSRLRAGRVPVTLRPTAVADLLDAVVAGLPEADVPLAHSNGTPTALQRPVGF